MLGALSFHSVPGRSIFVINIFFFQEKTVILPAFAGLLLAFVALLLLPFINLITSDKSPYLVSCMNRQLKATLFMTMRFWQLWRDICHLESLVLQLNIAACTVQTKCSEPISVTMML